MKTLVLLRHAQADGAPPGATDLERPLTDMGAEQARIQGDWLRQRIRFDRVLCSPAARTQGTAQSAGIAVDHVIDALYEATPGQLLLVVESHCDAENLLLIGHNPGVSGLAGYLTGRRMIMAPGAIVGIDFASPGPPQPGSGTVRLFRPPPTAA